MPRPNPFSILNRAPMTQAIRRQGAAAFGNNAFPGQFFGQAVFEQSQEHILGTENQTTVLNDSTIYFDTATSTFLDKDLNTVTLADYDRVAMLVDTADTNITFPSGLTIVFVQYEPVNLGGNTLTLAGTYQGDLIVNNGSVVITGECQGLNIDGTATVDATAMTAGTVFINGLVTIRGGATVDSVNLTSLNGVEVTAQTVPVGSIIGLHPDVDDAKAIDSTNWRACDGVGNFVFTYSDGTTSGSINTPNLTDSRFLMGGTSTGTGGSNTLLDHTHTSALSGDSHRHRMFVNVGSTSAITSNPNSNVAVTGNASGEFRYIMQASDTGPTLGFSGSTTNAISGTIGTGSAPTSTDSRPRYFTVKYFIRIR